MRELTVLSPHRDDAVFSLANSLRQVCAAGVRVEVINFFTHSSYAPRTTAHDRSAASISALRKREDCAALRTLHPGIKITDYLLLDAPLRLEQETAAVMDNSTAVRAEDVTAVARLLRRVHTIAPLGIGDHIDHRTVRDAAIAAVPAHRLAFYADLPYVTWTPKEQIHQRIEEIATPLRLKFRPWLLRCNFSMRYKQRLAALYATQITPQDAATIAAWPEQIWIPARSSAWLRLRSAASARNIR